MPAFTKRIPPDDSHPRDVCDTCGYVAYQNPKVVVGAVIVHDGQVLLCRRAIEPRRGFWTIPAGYLELDETVAEGAQREAFEEAGARISIDGTLALFSISRIGQVQVIFRAGFADGPTAAPVFAPGVESLDVRLFSWDDIPWKELAFPSVHWSLHAWRQAGTGPLGAPATNPPNDPRGRSPEVPAEAAA